jgi:hypothetical protein
MKLDLIRLADYESRVNIIKGSGKSLFQKVKLINIEIKNLHTDIFKRRKGNDQGQCESRSKDGTGSL